MSAALALLATPGLVRAQARTFRIGLLGGSSPSSPEAGHIWSAFSCWTSRAAPAGGVDDYRDEAFGTMAKNADGKLAMTIVALKPSVRFGGDKVPDRAQIEHLHHRAQQKCFIANSVKTEVRCEPVMEG